MVVPGILGLTNNEFRFALEPEMLPVGSGVKPVQVVLKAS